MSKPQSTPAQTDTTPVVAESTEAVPAPAEKTPNAIVRLGRSIKKNPKPLIAVVAGTILVGLAGALGSEKGYSNGYQDAEDDFAAAWEDEFGSGSDQDSDSTN